MADISTIKGNIKTLLDTLVSGTLGSVSNQDFKVDVLSDNLGNFPRAVIQPPAIETSDFLDNRNVLRTYTFPIAIIMKGENINDATDVENLQEAIMNLFDNEVDGLSGSADGGLQPSTSSPEPIQSGSKTYVMFVVEIRVRASQLLTF